MAASKTKTSFTLDRNLFTRAERLSKKLSLTRSDFYARAIADLVQTLEDQDLIARINAAQASLSNDALDEGHAVTAFLREATARTLRETTGSEPW